MIWGISNFTLRLWLLSTHEAVVALVSWLLFCKLFPPKEKARFGNTNSFLRFTLLAVLIPITINSIYVYHYAFVQGDPDKVALYWLSDFITILPLSIALLYFFSFDKTSQSFKRKRLNFSNRLWVELGLVTLVFIILSLLFPFDKYWFIYGIGATLFALRWGFAAAVVLNTIIFMLSYLLPLFEFASSLLISLGSTQFISVHLGMSTMMFVSLLVGRVVTDLHTTEMNLKNEKLRVEIINQELEQANQELDHFVYSVSHDLSAPLKSIKGLVTISRLQPDQANVYLDKIELSANKLEEFINEVLDYSRATRKNIELEQIHIKELIEEINSKLEFMENFSKIEFTYNLKIPMFTSDRVLVKVALGNIISNAIKYQKKFKEHHAKVIFNTFQNSDEVIIEVVDNGEGIQDQYKEKLFSMFYRGTASASGSGLGLYIARESIKKIGGQVSFESVWGQGSTFRIHLPGL